MEEAIAFALAAGLMPIVVTALILHHRRKTKELEMRGNDPLLGLEVDVLRAQLAEMQERLDFTERLLAGGSASQEDTSA
jgi:hypothetical protein